MKFYLRIISKILDEHVNIYFKVDYPLNSKFVIISILNFFSFSFL